MRYLLLILFLLLNGCSAYYKSSVEVGQCYERNYDNRLVIRVDEKLEFGVRLTVWENSIDSRRTGYLKFSDFDMYTQRDCPRENKD